MRRPEPAFPCEMISRADAAALAQQLAHRLKLPLRIENCVDKEYGTEHFAATVATEVHGPADLRQGAGEQ